VYHTIAIAGKRKGTSLKKMVAIMEQTNQNLYEQNKVLSHPGETLKELMSSNHVSVKELSTRLGVTPKCIKDIIAGQEDVSSFMARKLADVFPLSAEFWNSLQSNYDKSKSL
jgi:addiction module HigA family antidote